MVAVSRTCIGRDAGTIAAFLGSPRLSNEKVAGGHSGGGHQRSWRAIGDFRIAFIMIRTAAPFVRMRKLRCNNVHDRRASHSPGAGKWQLPLCGSRTLEPRLASERRQHRLAYLQMRHLFRKQTLRCFRCPAGVRLISRTFAAARRPAELRSRRCRERSPGCADRAEGANPNSSRDCGTPTSANGTPATIREGQSQSALPCISDVDLFGYRESVVDLNAEIAHRPSSRAQESCTARRLPVWRHSSTATRATCGQCSFCWGTRRLRGRCAISALRSTTLSR